MGNHIFVSGNEYSGDTEGGIQSKIIIGAHRNSKPRSNDNGGCGNFPPSNSLDVIFLCLLLMEKWGGNSKPTRAESSEYPGCLPNQKNNNCYIVFVHLVSPRHFT